MAVSRNTGNRSQPSFWQRVFGQLSRYDLLLVAIPLAFLLSSGLSLFAGIPLEVAVGIGAVLSCVFVADGIYFNPPLGTTEEMVSPESPGD